MAFLATWLSLQPFQLHIDWYWGYTHRRNYPAVDNILKIINFNFFSDFALFHMRNVLSDAQNKDFFMLLVFMWF